MNHHHTNILALIKKNSGRPTKHTFLDNYLGNTHPRYAIDNPTMRQLAKTWAREHKDLTPKEFQSVLTSLIHGKSGTEKFFAGILLDYATKDQQSFDPECLEDWLDQLVGWAEVDTLCTGHYTIKAIPENFGVWKKILIRLSKSKNISKRRASLVLLCSPLRRLQDDRLVEIGLQHVDRLKHEREVLITKAISWVLRSMILKNRPSVKEYLSKNRSSLPSIAVRETDLKLKTGRKSGKPKE
jgi:3-methyladenine DNA glycosylase AlkD